MLAKDPWHSSVVYMDAEAFDIRLRPASKFLLVQILHMNCDVSVYQSTGQCLSFGTEFNFTAPYFDLYLYSKTCLKQNLKGPEHFSAKARFSFNQGTLHIKN